jgi:hypothetical protein
MNKTPLLFKVVSMIQDFKDGIHKDLSVLDPYNVYIGNGYGCGTIWFKNVKAARKALDKDGIKTGRDLVDCKKCACKYSLYSKEHKEYPVYLCFDAKEAYAKSFE